MLHPLYCGSFFLLRFTLVVTKKKLCQRFSNWFAKAGKPSYASKLALTAAPQRRGVCTRVYHYTEEAELGAS